MSEQRARTRVHEEKPLPAAWRAALGGLLLLVLPVLPAGAADPGTAGAPAVRGPSVAGEELDAVLKELQAVLHWDPVTETGQLVLEAPGPGARGDRIVFRVGSPWLIVNYRDKIEAGAVRREQGAILFPEGTAGTLRRYFEERSRRSPPHRVAAILIDPGHGGKDSGAIGIHGTGKQELKVVEKQVVLDVGRRVHELLRREFPDKQVLLTRDQDTYLKLEERTELANGISLADREAILFVSIHANAAFNRQAKGYEVWILPSDYRRELIDPESLGEGNRSIAPILNVLLEEEYSIESATLARAVLDSFDEQVGDLTENRGIREESWFVVRNAKMPSILIELGYVTNSEEARLLADPAYLQKLAEGIYTGVRRFVASFESTKGFTE